MGAVTVSFRHRSVPLLETSLARAITSSETVPGFARLVSFRSDVNISTRSIPRSDPLCFIASRSRKTFPPLTETSCSSGCVRTKDAGAGLRVGVVKRVDAYRRFRSRTCLSADA